MFGVKQNPDAKDGALLQPAQESITIRRQPLSSSRYQPICQCGFFYHDGVSDSVCVQLAVATAFVS